MLVTVHCPNAKCRLAYEVSKDKLGKQGRCRKCGALFTLNPPSQTTPQQAARDTKPDSRSTCHGSTAPNRSAVQTVGKGPDVSESTASGGEKEGRRRAAEGGREERPAQDAGVVANFCLTGALGVIGDFSTVMRDSIL